MGVAIDNEWDFGVMKFRDEFQFWVGVAQGFFIHGPGVNLNKIIVIPIAYCKLK